MQSTYFTCLFLAFTTKKSNFKYSCKAVVGGPVVPAMAGLVFGNGIKLTSSIKSINFRIYSFCSFVDFEINSARLEFILSLSSLIVG